MKKLFYLNQAFLRNELKDSNYTQFKKGIESKLNIHSIEKWSNKKIMKYISPDDFNNYIAYIFELFDSWLKDNERFTKTFLLELELVINKLNLEKYFNQEETNYIEHIFNVVFAKTRVLKDIIVDYEVDKDEKVYFKYDINYIEQNFANYQFVKMFEGANIYLTTKRIVFADRFEFLSIQLSDLTSVSLHNEYLKISTNQRDFIIYSFDIFLIYISLERMGRVIKKYL